jgi:hypothetical protein
MQSAEWIAPKVKFLLWLIGDFQYQSKQFPFTVIEWTSKGIDNAW